MSSPLVFFHADLKSKEHKIYWKGLFSAMGMGVQTEKCIERKPFFFCSSIPAKFICTKSNSKGIITNLECSLDQILAGSLSAGFVAHSEKTSRYNYRPED